MWRGTRNRVDDAGLDGDRRSNLRLGDGWRRHRTTLGEEEIAKVIHGQIDDLGGGVHAAAGELDDAVVEVVGAKLGGVHAGDVADGIVEGDADGGDEGRDAAGESEAVADGGWGDAGGGVRGPLKAETCNWVLYISVPVGFRRRVRWLSRKRCRCWLVRLAPG